MMSIEYINELSREASTRAKDLGLVPEVIWFLVAADGTSYDELPRERQRSRLRSIPSLGFYRPQGWTLVGSVLVDKTGLGDSGSALSVDELCDAVSLEDIIGSRGLGWIEEGQPDDVLGIFERWTEGEADPPLDDCTRLEEFNGLEEFHTLTGHTKWELGKKADLTA